MFLRQSFFNKLQKLSFSFLSIFFAPLLLWNIMKYFSTYTFLSVRCLSYMNNICFLLFPCGLWILVFGYFNFVVVLFISLYGWSHSEIRNTSVMDMNKNHFLFIFSFYIQNEQIVLQLSQSKYINERNT